MRVLFLPDYPDKEFYTIVAIFMRLGYFATNDPQSSFDFGMLWQDATWLESDPVLTQIALQKPVLNLRCVDISKRKVEAVFKQVFAASTFINPATAQGRCVKKYDKNASGGFVVDLPQDDSDERFVFQRLLDSRQGDVMVEYRVPVILGSIPVVYIERKDLPVDHIKTTKRSIQVTDPLSVFSSSEIALILEFSQTMGLDFGELDIIRANDDRRIYILDANKTPGGFGMMNKAQWAVEQRSQVIDLLADAFDRNIQLLLK